MKQSRRSFLQTGTLMTTGTLIGASSALTSMGSACSVSSPMALRLNPTPLFEISPLLFMQFMEPLGLTDPSVEGSWNYDDDTWRKDFVDCVRDLGPDMIRWGGNYTRYYKWREGIGDPKKRPWMYNYDWAGRESNRVGTHEFVDFCHQVGAEPLLGVNFESDGVPFFKDTNHHENRCGSAEEAADWVSYCNDAVHKERRMNGSDEAFGVKIWQLGNETSYTGADGFNVEKYLETLERFATKMRERDPSIQLIGWGDAPACQNLYPGESIEGNEPWASRVLNGSGDLLSYIAFHMMGVYPRTKDTLLKSYKYLNDPASAWNELVELGEIPEYRLGIFRKELSKTQSKAKLAITEGHLSLSPHNINPILTSWLSTAYHARSLNSYLRNGDIVKICTAADFAGSRWTVNAVMLPQPGGQSYLLPVGHLMKWYNREKGTHGIKVEQSPSDLDVAASRNENSIFIHVLNKNFSQAVQTNIDIPGVNPVGGTVYEMAPDDRMAHIDQTMPESFAPIERKFEPGKPWSFPAASVSIMKITLSVCVAFLLLFASCKTDNKEPEKEKTVWDDFLIKKTELNLNLNRGDGERKLSFANFDGTPEEWRVAVKQKFTELLDFSDPDAGPVHKVREMIFEGVKIQAFIMQVSDQLSIHAYLLEPADGKVTKSDVMGIHGHGRVEPVIGQSDDYHHKFGWELARDGHRVLCPELRGFSQMNNLAAGDTLNCLDYWEGRWQFTYPTDAFLRGKSMVGETIEDLIRWEKWMIASYGVSSMDVCGISYGGDLTIYYPVFSKVANRLFCSGSMGSFSWIFRSCYNAPGHCIPDVLEWMDRSDIAGLLAPKPILIHYGEYDTPSPDNASAANNPSGPVAFEELKTIYQALGAPVDNLTYLVTQGIHHEMDIPALKAFFR